MIKKTVSGSGEYTNYYVGPHYEKNATTTVVTKYYTSGSQRVAMRVCTGTNGSCGPHGATSPLTYLHADALGSASLATTVTGTLVSQRRYLPYGATRWSSGAMPTDRRYTGQREEASLGLYDYGARMYDVSLGRFVSADTIIPEAGNPQSLNRYMYVLGNPLRYSDPTGHTKWAPPSPSNKGHPKSHLQHISDSAAKQLQSTSDQAASTLNATANIIPAPAGGGGGGYGDYTTLEEIEALYYELRIPPDGKIYSLSGSAGALQTVYYYSLDIVLVKKGEVALFITTADNDIANAALYRESNGALPFATPQFGLSVSSGYLIGSALNRYGARAYEGDSWNINLSGAESGTSAAISCNNSTGLPSSPIYPGSGVVAFSIAPVSIGTPGMAIYSTHSSYLMGMQLPYPSVVVPILWALSEP